jgi:hypothetical protein
MGSVSLWLRKQEFCSHGRFVILTYKTRVVLLMGGVPFLLWKQEFSSHGWLPFWFRKQRSLPKSGRELVFFLRVGGWEAAAMAFASGLGLAMPYYSSTFSSSSLTHCHHAHHHLHLPLQRSYFNSAIPLRLLITPSVHWFYVSVCVSLSLLSLELFAIWKKGWKML